MLRHPVLPAQKIQELINTNKVIKANDKNVQPASLDIHLTNYNPMRLYKGQTYILPVKEKFNCEHIFELHYSARSTTARNGLYTSYCSETNTITLRPLECDLIIPSYCRIGQIYFLDISKTIQDYVIEKQTLDLCKHSLTNPFTKLLKDTTIYLGTSTNVVKIPNDCVGFLQEFEPNNGMYFTHLNAGLFDPNFQGKAVYEIMMLNNNNVKNVNFNKFAELHYIPLTEPTNKPYHGNYQNQDSIESILPKTSYQLTENINACSR